MSKVYVVQKPVRIIKDNNGRAVDTVPLFNMSPAMEFGDLVILFEPGEVGLLPDRVASVLQRKLTGFSDDDYLLPVGDTVLVAAVAARAAGYNNGRYKVLRWDKRDGAYTELQYDLYGGNN